MLNSIIKGRKIMLKEFEMIVTIVQKGQADKVVEASREGGARGGTIIYGRGTGIHDSESVLGVQIQPEKEIIFTLAETYQKPTIMKLICEKAKLNTPGAGLCFSLPVNRILGSKKMMKASQIQKLKKEKDKKIKANNIPTKESNKKQ